MHSRRSSPTEKSSQKQSQPEFIMDTTKDPIAERKASLDENPRGVGAKVIAQRERERGGRYYPVPGDKCHTQIFVRHCEDPSEKIRAYKEKQQSA